MPKSMRTIEVDGEVFAYLQRHSEPLVDTPNDVLRRQLLNDKRPSADRAGNRKTGVLMPIIEAGLAAPGDKVRHYQSRLKRTHEATITADGWVEIPDGRSFPQPSPALKTQTGSEINGWGHYTHIPSGRRLQELREELAKHQA
ncbi:restriction system modified-DNA reader domain-containing protein [Streptomyces lydicus]|uniref:restriction system modified-DNA reader domain-containing protein n=1 Tax=Streptomyces lydicus TaxID=47763 RepID=UPI0037B0C79A